MKNKIIPRGVILGTILLEGILVVALVTGLFSFAFAGIGQNVTVLTQLEVGNVYPEVLNVTLNSGNAITLTANTTTLVSCIGVLRDYNGQDDINTTATAVLFDTASSTFGATDDNNKHYSNTSCAINTTFGSYNTYNDDEYMALANCSFYVWYYANPATWNCTLTVNDTAQWQGSSAKTQTVNQLLSLLLPGSINYGIVNATFVSDEKAANVTNVGNVAINLTLEGYGASEGDGLAMNCTRGNIQNISIEHEKYNLTSTTTGSQTLEQFNGNYTNLTSDAVTRVFNLPYRLNDTDQFVDDTNATYWRIYVPRGVAGNCTGHIIFGAIVAAGS